MFTSNKFWDKSQKKENWRGIVKNFVLNLYHEKSTNTACQLILLQTAQKYLQRQTMSFPNKLFFLRYYLKDFIHSVYQHIFFLPSFKVNISL